MTGSGMPTPEPIDALDALVVQVAQTLLDGSTPLWVLFMRNDGAVRPTTSLRCISRQLPAQQMQPVSEIRQPFAQNGTCQKCLTSAPLGQI
jgi:hypothetical protein